VRLAHALLELPAEAGKEPSSVDDPGATGPGDGTFPLDQPTSFVTRAVPSPDVPRRPTVRLQSQRRTAHARQCRAIARRRGHCPGDPRTALGAANEEEKAAAFAATARGSTATRARGQGAVSLPLPRRRPRRASGRGIGEQGKTKGGGVEEPAHAELDPQTVGRLVAKTKGLSRRGAATP